MRNVSRRNQSVLDRHDALLWKPLCQELWKDKRGFSGPVPKSFVPKIPWKSLYFQSIADSKRLTLKARELEEYSWEVVFKTDAHQARAHVTFDVTGPQSGEVLIKGQSRAFPFQLDQGGAMLHVHVFPSHHVTRIADWGWQIENYFVRFESVQVDFPHHILIHAGFPTRPP
jgi:hypothetical protein